MSNDLKIPENEVLKNIYSRRSIRDYLPDDIADDVVRELIRAATYAPSAANMQPWRFVVIKNRDLIAKLSGRSKELWLEQAGRSTRPEMKSLVNMVSRPNFNIFFNAPLLIMIFSDFDAFSPQIDCALAGENMMLAARSLGIGSCWIGLASPLGQDPAILADLGVPDRCKLEGTLIFGYPTKLDHKAPRRDKEVVLKWIE
ncbi:MAG: nitroreductase [Methanothrix sp.]|nr:nitroreductase [Methanothrix sp.]